MTKKELNGVEGKEFKKMSPKEIADFIFKLGFTYTQLSFIRGLLDVIKIEKEKNEIIEQQAKKETRKETAKEIFKDLESKFTNKITDTIMWKKLKKKWLK